MCACVLGLWGDLWPSVSLQASLREEPFLLLLFVVQKLSPAAVWASSSSLPSDSCLGAQTLPLPPYVYLCSCITGPSCIGLQRAAAEASRLEFKCNFRKKHVPGRIYVRKHSLSPHSESGGGAAVKMIHRNQDVEPKD